MEDRYGRIKIAEFQFLIVGGEYWDTAGFEEGRLGGSLLRVGTSCVSVASHTDNRYAGLRALAFPTEPPMLDLDDWEHTAEASATFNGDPAPYFLVPLAEPGWGVDPEIEDFYLAPGTYRVRGYAKGCRAADEVALKGFGDNEEEPTTASEAVEQFRIEFWPTSHHSPPTVLKP